METITSEELVYLYNSGLLIVLVVCGMLRIAKLALAVYSFELEPDVHGGLKSIEESRGGPGVGMVEEEGRSPGTHTRAEQQ
jgi:hypothetical protein